MRKKGRKTTPGLTKIKKQKTDRVALTSSHISTLLSLWMYRYERIDDILGQTCFFLPLPPLSKYFRTVEWMSCSLLLYFSFLSPSFHHGDVWKLAPVEAVWSRGIVQIKPPSRTKRRVKIEFKKTEKKPSYEIDRESAHNRRTIYQQITSSSWSLIDPSEIRGLSRPYRLTEEHFNQRIKRDNRKDKGGSGWERDINFFSYAILGFFSSISLHALRNVYGTI